MLSVPGCILQNLPKGCRIMLWEPTSALVSIEESTKNGNNEG